VVVGPNHLSELVIMQFGISYRTPISHATTVVDTRIGPC